MKTIVLFILLYFLNGVFIFANNNSSSKNLPSSFEVKIGLVKNTNSDSSDLEKIKWFDVPVVARYYLYNNYTGCTIDSFQTVLHPQKGILYEIKVHKDKKTFYFFFNQKGDLVKMRRL